MEYSYEESSEEPVTGGELKQLSNLVNTLGEKNKRIAELQSELKALQGEERELREQMIPELMDEIGVASITTDDGFHVRIEEKLHASIPKANKDAACDWLKEHGYGKVINAKYEIAIKSGQEKLAEKIQEALDEINAPYQQSRDVHWAKLTKLIKELESEGVDVPRELFGAHEIRQAKVT